MLRSPPVLPNGRPGVRLRHLVQRYHAFGPRALLDFVQRLIDGRLPDALAVVEFLEHSSQSDPGMVRAIGGYELPSPVFDLTWVIESDRRSGRPPRPRGRPRKPPSSRAALRLVPQEDAQ
jgi:hypothetical protein